MMPVSRNLDEEAKLWKEKWSKMSALEFLDQTMEFYKKVRFLADDARLPPFILASVLDSVSEEVRGSPNMDMMIGLYLSSVKTIQDYTNKNFMRKEVPWEDHK